MTGDEIERLQVIAENADALRRNLEDVSCRQQNEIERLRKVLAIEGLSCKVAADIERQQAEIERLRASHNFTKDCLEQAEAEIEQLREENMVLRGLVADKLRSLSPSQRRPRSHD